jgi:hypothetical protein
LKWLSNVTQINNETTVKQLSIGTASRKQAAAIHPAYNNKDRLSYQMKVMKKNAPSVNLKNIQLLEEEGVIPFLKENSGKKV